LVPLSVQVGAPVVQVSVPVWQGLVGVQAPPEAQVVQLPALHTMFAPQLVPLARLPDSMQTGEPVAHDVVPVLHVLVGWQLEPAAHDTQVPALQTLSVPQPAPFVSGLPVSLQAMFGEQTVMPAWHGFAGTQAVPAEHAAQLPAAHTMLAPHMVPLGASADSMQTGVPVLQAMVPLRQGLPGTTQSIPCTHAAQLPPLQTMSVPHDVPTATFVPVSVHVGAEPEQTSAPVWHLFVGVHAPPAWQVAHVPAWQTIPVPHVVPFGLLSLSVQTGAPVVQTMLPTRQGRPVTSQAMPSVQASQLPLWQTRLAPQIVPFAWRSVISMHDIAPSRQTNCPLWQGLAGTHAPPATQTGASTLPPSTIMTPPMPPAALPPVVPPAPPPGPPSVVVPPPPPPVPPRPGAPAALPALPVGPPSPALRGRLRSPPHPATAISRKTVRERLSSIRATS
jgi:hypothetical protein